MNITSNILIGIIVALGTGLAVGLQGLFVGTLGSILEPLRSGWYVHVGGMLTGGAMVLLAIALRPTADAALDLTWQTALLAVIAGTCGMGIIVGIAFAFPRVGQVAGQAAIIFGQLGVALAVDAFGLLTDEPVPVDARRVLGLFVMIVAIYLLLPSPSQT